MPVKAARAATVEERRAVYWIERNGELLLWQRQAGERLMPGFWELPEAVHLPGVTPGLNLGSFRHGITFHNYSFDVLAAGAPAAVGDCKWVPVQELGKMPISTIVKKARKSVSRARAATSG